MVRLPSETQAGPRLFDISWERDQAYRMNPLIVTELLREQVPVLDYVGWHVTTIEPGVAHSELPLNPASTNQHFTHQAALFLLAADYTGGTALASLLVGWPVIGVHPIESTQAVSLWLLKAEIKYMRPSVANLAVSARVKASRHERLQKRFLEGKTVIETIDIEFRNGETVVGEASATYFAKQTEKLRAEGVAVESVNALYELKLTSSAELIAAVRARENGRLFHDPYAQHMAGQHGMALASRFCERSPQLGGMVAARTRHLDEAMLNFVRSGGRDIVLVGAGWDMRPFRLQLPQDTQVFELDFPTILIERQKRIKELKLAEPKGVSRIQVPIDVRTMSLYEALADKLSTDVPTFVAWEGMCMYFQDEEVRKILRSMMPLLVHPDSVLWLDLVDRQAILHPQQFSKSVENFMLGMQILGEPFTFGTDSATEFMSSEGLRALEVVPSDLYLPGNNDRVYSIYHFCMAALKSNRNGRMPKTFRPARFDPAHESRQNSHQVASDRVTHPRPGSALDSRALPPNADATLS